MNTKQKQYKNKKNASKITMVITNGRSTGREMLTSLREEWKQANGSLDNYS